MTDLNMIDLGRRLEEYLRIRRSLGFKLARDAKLLAQFIGYLHERAADVITVDHVVAWVGLPGGGRDRLPSAFHLRRLDRRAPGVRST